MVGHQARRRPSLAGDLAQADRLGTVRAVEPQRGLADPRPPGEVGDRGARHGLDNTHPVRRTERLDSSLVIRIAGLYSRVMQILTPRPYASPWMGGDVADVAGLARHFFATEVVPHLERFDAQHQVDTETWLAAGRAGLLCVSGSEEFGGGGGTFAHEAAVMWEQARSGDDSFGYSVHSGIVAPYLEVFGSEEQSAAGARDGQRRARRRSR